MVSRLLVGAEVTGTGVISRQSTSVGGILGRADQSAGGTSSLNFDPSASITPPVILAGISNASNTGTATVVNDGPGGAVFGAAVNTYAGGTSQLNATSASRGSLVAGYARST